MGNNSHYSQKGTDSQRATGVKKGIREAPPPMDESWWQAVLTEEERYAPLTDARKGEHSGPIDETSIHTYPGRDILGDESGKAPKELGKVGTNRDKSEGDRVLTDMVDQDDHLISDDPGFIKTGANQNAVLRATHTDWSKAVRLYEMDEAIDLPVSGYNRGGLLVDGNDLHGFVPISHLVDLQDCETEIESILQSYVGRSLSLKIIECDQARGRVVFSERAALSESGSRNQLLYNLQPGDCICGKVTNVTDFGVFVDLGGIEGLIHVSEISWGRVQHPKDVVELGQEITVYVIQVDQERVRVGLSLKRLHPNPWDTADIRYRPGQITDAVVTSIVPFGAFARLEEGLDGLIHISEMGDGDQIDHPSQVVQEGQHLKVRILHVDGPKQRLGLSLRLVSDSQLSTDPTSDDMSTEVEPESGQAQEL